MILETSRYNELDAKKILFQFYPAFFIVILETWFLLWLITQRILKKFTGFLFGNVLNLHEIQILFGDVLNLREI